MSDRDWWYVFDSYKKHWLWVDAAHITGVVHKADHEPATVVIDASGSLDISMRTGEVRRRLGLVVPPREGE